MYHTCIEKKVQIESWHRVHSLHGQIFSFTGLVVTLMAATNLSITTGKPGAQSNCGVARRLPGGQPVLRHGAAGTREGDLGRL